MIADKLETLLFGDKPSLINQETSTEIILGPVTSESRALAVRIAEHAIEKGSPVTDHVAPQPESLSITTFLADQNDYSAKAADKVSEFVGFHPDTMTVTDKLAFLERWKDNGDLLTYSGPVFSNLIDDGYDIMVNDMVIESMNIDRSSETGSGVNVSLQLRHVVIAEGRSAQVTLPGQKGVQKKGVTQTEKAKADKPGKVVDKSGFKKLAAIGRG